ncbi:hypothetical protein SeLEV6574_g01658 [Synchytrium endobioticum]|uniref:Cutinase n=1 Tax=Synchytrium endobioticum TaxID=286115 RepID=A0A507DBT8_9FUNG|nr:hypothetical protein SeLEV6574_g01658 [Synchytrium endobioticum]
MTTDLLSDKFEPIQTRAREHHRATLSKHTAATVPNMSRAYTLSKFGIALLVMLAFPSLGSASPIRLMKRAGGAVRNDAVEGGACKALMLIHARGTTEMSNMGMGVGIPFAAALEKLTADVGIQGVNDYDASVAGAITGGSKTGAEFMAKTAADVMQKCPKTKVILSGYSQGGQVLHLATDMMSPKVADKITAVVLFGDAKGKTTPVPRIPADKVLSMCNAGDNICENPMLPMITMAHLTYGTGVDEAAAFVKRKAGI